MKTFVDTCVVRLSQKTLKTWRRTREKTQAFGGLTEIDIVQPVEIDLLEKLNNPTHERQYGEALACSEIEELARQGKITLVWELETHLETVLNSTLGDPRPSIIELIEGINPPIQFSRLLDPSALLPFLRGISNPAYEKWKKALGIVLNSKRERNQMMDAWHLWTAEHNGCDCFVTTDRKMIDSISSRKTQTCMKILTPIKCVSMLKEYK